MTSEVFKAIVGFIKSQYPAQNFISLHAPLFIGNERKYVIDAYNANEIPSAELLRKKHAINEKIIRNPYHTIQFDCYVTKPLSAHGCFTVSAILNGDAEVTDKYIYQSLRYTFDKKNNIISAFVRGISQPWTIKELEMKN